MIRAESPHPAPLLPRDITEIPTLRHPVRPRAESKLRRTGTCAIDIIPTSDNQAEAPHPVRNTDRVESVFVASIRETCSVNGIDTAKQKEYSTKADEHTTAEP
jgi:hypothetical protein